MMNHDRKLDKTGTPKNRFSLMQLITERSNVLFRWYFCCQLRYCHKPCMCLDNLSLVKVTGYPHFERERESVSLLTICSDCKSKIHAKNRNMKLS